MTKLPPIVDGFTDDEHERYMLAHDDGPPDPNDPYHVEMHDIAATLANFRTKLTAAQRRLIPFMHQGLTNAEAAEKAGCSPQTVVNAMKSPHVRQCLRLLMQAERLQEGPVLAQRSAMLWRIAKRNEDTKPMVTIRAIEVIDKQQGVYQPEDKGGGNINVNVINYRIEQKFEQTPKKTEKEVNQAFKPVTIDADQ